MINIIYNRNSVHQAAYHVIWCTKYRKEILIDKIAGFANDVLIEICKDRNWPMLAVEIQPDHVHIFLTIPPAIAVADSIKILKGTSARKILMAFPQLKNELWGGHIWSPSYYLGTAGNVSAEIIQRYIERSEHVAKRR